MLITKVKTEIIIDKICNINKECSSIIMDDIYGHQECLYVPRSFEKLWPYNYNGWWLSASNRLNWKNILERSREYVFTVKKIRFKAIIINF